MPHGELPEFYAKQKSLFFMIPGFYLFWSATERWHLLCFINIKKMNMKKEQFEIIEFDDPSAIMYWSKKWEISPVKLFSTFLKIHSNRIDKLKYHLRKAGFAL
jgi:hypothetical protein